MRDVCLREDQERSVSFAEIISQPDPYDGDMQRSSLMQLRGRCIILEDCMLNLHHGQIVTINDIMEVQFIIIGFRYEWNENQQSEYMAVLVDCERPEDSFSAPVSICKPIRVH